MEDASKDILKRYGEKKEDLYGRIEKELKELQQVICLVSAVPIAPSLAQIAELVDEPANWEYLQMRQKLNFRESRKRRRRLQKPWNGRNMKS